MLAFSAFNISFVCSITNTGVRNTVIRPVFGGQQLGHIHWTQAGDD